MKESDRISSIFLWTSFSVLNFGLAFHGCNHQNLNLKDYSKHSGILIEKGYGYTYSSKSRIKCYYVIVDNLENQKLGVHIDYLKDSKLQNSISVGDSITVYFTNYASKSASINTDLVQIESKGQIIFDKSEYSSRYEGFIYIGSILGILFFLVSSLFWTKKE